MVLLGRCTCGSGSGLGYVKGLRTSVLKTEIERNDDVDILAEAMKVARADFKMRHSRKRSKERSPDAYLVFRLVGLRCVAFARS